MNKQTTSMSFLHSNLNISHEEGINLEPIWNFFQTHFIIKHNSNLENSIADIYITSNKDGNDNLFNNYSDVYLRKSASDFFTIKAKKSETEKKEYILIEETGTLLIFNSYLKEITICLNSNLAKKDELTIIELVRDLVLKNEENRGVLVLHATSALKDGKVSLIIGSKGAGKSTTLLEFVKKDHYQLMSGDKTFVWIQNGELFASGWPDYPHLGLGTISKYPDLINKLQLKDQIENNLDDIWSTKHKIAVSPEKFKEVFNCTEAGLTAPVKKIYYPKLQDSKDCDLTAIENDMELICPHIESLYNADGNYWNNFIELQRSHLEYSDILNALENIDAYKIEGNGIIDNYLTSK